MDKRRRTLRAAPQEVDGCYSELLQKNVEFIEAPRDQEYGHRTLDLLQK